jgi:hypothetical protein
MYGFNVFLMADKKNPHVGIIVKMSSSSIKYNCSLAVSVLCNVNGVQVRLSLIKVNIIELMLVELIHIFIINLLLTGTTNPGEIGGL